MIDSCTCAAACVYSTRAARSVRHVSAVFHTSVASEAHWNTRERTFKTLGGNKRIRANDIASFTKCAAVCRQLLVFRADPGLVGGGANHTLNKL